MTTKATLEAVLLEIAKHMHGCETCISALMEFGFKTTPNCDEYQRLKRNAKTLADKSKGAAS